MLAEALAGFGLPHPVVLALPRGGVPVAAEIARKLAAGVAALPRDMAGKFPSIVVQQPT